MQPTPILIPSWRRSLFRAIAQPIPEAQAGRKMYFCCFVLRLPAFPKFPKKSFCCGNLVTDHFYFAEGSSNRQRIHRRCELPVAGNGSGTHVVFFGETFMGWNKVVILTTLFFRILVSNWSALRLLLPVVPLAAQITGLVWEGYSELFSNTKKFESDYTAMAQYLTLPDEQKAYLLSLPDNS